MTKTMSRMDTAAPNGQLRAVANWKWMRLPSIRRLPPPKRSGAMKAPIEGMKTSSEPAMMPGLASGMMTWRAACHFEA